MNPYRFPNADPDEKIRGQWRPSDSGNYEEQFLVWILPDGRELSDRDLRIWCNCNLEPAYCMSDGIARAYHFNAWLACNPTK